MKHRAFVTVCLLLLANTLTVPLANSTTMMNRDEFSPQDMVIRDDAFHGRGKLPFTEWWYFDAMLDNGYSVQMSIRIISLLGKGLVFERLDIYYNNTIIIDQTKTFQIRDLNASSEIPLVQLQGTTIFTGTLNTTTGFFDYAVSFEFPGYAANLRFVGCTQGWKGQQKGGDWWAVALPRADVSGSLIVDNETIYVVGTGYHDHNWDITATSVMRFGWFWGKFNSPDYTVTWSILLPNRISKVPILVVNKRNASYLAIPQSEVWFSAEDIHSDHLMRVPHFFNIGTMTKTVLLIVDMAVIHVDYKRIMGTMHYWRFHVKCTGTILLDGRAQTINGVFIAEYVRFR